MMILKKFGINIIITNNSIKIDGILNLNQYDSIYKFFIMIMNVYEYFSNYKKDSEFQNIF